MREVLREHYKCLFSLHCSPEYRRKQEICTAHSAVAWQSKTPGGAWLDPWPGSAPHPHLLTFNLGVTGLNRTKTHCKRFSQKIRELHATGERCTCRCVYLTYKTLGTMPECSICLQNKCVHLSLLQQITKDRLGFEQDIAISPAHLPGVPESSTKV